MSMEHKAFVFDYNAFAGEVRPLLETSLQTGDVQALRHFINMNLKLLKDPYDGAPLPPDWEAALVAHDTDEYGDFALTKFYQPDKDIGLGPRWMTLHDTLAAVSKTFGTAILGTPLKSGRRVFDPGKMGSYFQTSEQAAGNLKLLRSLRGDGRLNGTCLPDAIEMYRTVVSAEKGCYITF
jgi:hypothetical protein